MNIQVVCAAYVTPLDRLPMCNLQVRDVQLINPTRRPLSYTARLEGPADFSLETSVVKIDPGRTTQVSQRRSIVSDKQQLLPPLSVLTLVRFSLQHWVCW